MAVVVPSEQCASRPERPHDDLGRAGSAFKGFPRQSPPQRPRDAGFSGGGTGTSMPRERRPIRTTRLRRWEAIGGESVAAGKAGTVNTSPSRSAPMTSSCFSLPPAAAEAAVRFCSSTRASIRASLGNSAAASSAPAVHGQQRTESLAVSASAGNRSRRDGSDRHRAAPGRSHRRRFRQPQ